MDTDEVDLPKSALSYYVRLYCKKKSSNGSTEKHCRLQAEATKSWTKLDCSERQFFIEKYNEYQNNVKSFANKLRSAVPYLKKKDVDSNIINECSNVSIEWGHNTLEDANNCENEHELSNNLNENQSFDIIPHLRSIQENITSLLEPTPPKIMNAQQLFEIIQESSENPVTWKSLTGVQKRRYHNAVCRIKRTYFTEYKRYLENLPDNKLYDYYKNIKAASSEKELLLSD